MRLETAFLRSAVARRVFWLMLAGAALPLVVFAALAYGVLAERLDSLMHSRLHEAAKYAGLRVYDRLVSAQTALATLAASPAGASPSAQVPLAARALFERVATVEHAGGAVQGSAELAALWRRLAADPRDTEGRRLWWAAGSDGAVGRVLVGVRTDARWWIAELAPQFLWDDLRERDAAVGTCVVDARGVRLLCPHGLSDAKADAAAGIRSASWSLFTRGDFGSIDWVFTRRAAPEHLLVGGFPFEQVAWKAALFSLLLVLVLSLVLIRRTTVPLERLLDGTRALARRDWSARVTLAGGDEFGQLAGSFNDMAGRIERQMQALQVQSAIDREILDGPDTGRALQRVLQRLRRLVPGVRVSLLLAPDDGGRWRRVAEGDESGAAVAVDPELLGRLQRGPIALRGDEARHVARQLQLDVQSGLCLVPAQAQGRTRALLLLDGALPECDDDLRRELDELADRVAVMLVAAERDRALRERIVRDSLTALLNRGGLIEQIEQRLAAPAASAFVLAFIDLDGFKSVNDSRGHPVGDALLCEVATVLRAMAPQALAIARPGGDEFVLLLPPEREPAGALAAALCRRLAEPFVIDGHTLRIGASIGLVACPEQGRERVELMRRADLAMYAAKAAGRARHAWFEPALDRRAEARAWVQSELPVALQRDALRLYFQPRVRAGDRRLASVEALVRWPHPTRGLVQPARFVPLAEETGLIGALDRWVLEAACRQMRAWRDAGVDVPRVAVNVSALQLAEPGFAAGVLDALRRHALPPGVLEIELTESVFAGDADEAAARLQPLRDAGVQLALDDFGTGFSSLSSLYRLPVDVMKIDRSFVCDLGRRDSADAVARSVVALARALGKHVVAEGVETPEQLRRLLALGCDELQGYLIARPLPAEALAPWLQAATAEA
ncbi:MAG: EAL domain-containing protein [Proteobacteria bacterium]|nr:EAL domain-containing protein [Pseudomonadota bacterium]